ncbi:hypothetical protein [Flavobacterium pedocola]
MSDFKQRIENLKKNGYPLDFGDVFSQSIENYKKIAVTAGLAMILLTIVFMVVGLGSLGVFVGFTDFASKMADFQISNFSSTTLVFYILGTALFSALTYPFTAGLIKMAHEAELNREINFSMVFDHYKSDSFKDLFFAALLISLTTTTIATLCEYTGFKFIGFIVTYGIALFAVFTIPLIIFGKLNYMDAIKSSFALVMRQPFVILGSLIVSAIIAMVGLIGLCIGIFFTLPFVYSTFYILYKNAVGVEVKHEIDEIGNSSDI